MPIADVSSKSLTDLTDLSGRRVIITGGARGMGAAMARRFAEAGGRVLIADLNGDLARQTAEHLAKEFETAVVAVEADVTEDTAITRLVGTARAELGGIDVWINNAGIFPNVPLLEVEPDLWDRVQDLNVRAGFLGAQAAARVMIEQGTGGVIINFASTQGFKAQGDGFAAYVTSKHAVVGMTKALAGELGRHGIRVLGIAPGLVMTEGVAEMQAKFATVATPELLRAYEAGEMARPLGRACVPDDIARIALFLASDLSLIMTGSTLFADGGDGIR